MRTTVLSVSTIQYDDEEESCMAYQAEYPPQGNCESVVEVLIVANNVHEENAGSFTVEREHAGLRNHTLEELEAPWQAWSVYDWLVGNLTMPRSC